MSASNDAAGRTLRRVAAAAITEADCRRDPAGAFHVALAAARGAQVALAAAAHERRVADARALLAREDAPCST